MEMKRQKIFGMNSSYININQCKLKMQRALHVMLWMDIQQQESFQMKLNTDILNN